MGETKLARVQEKGQVTLPASLRQKLGLKKGDLITFRETPEGILITPSETFAKQDLAQVDAALREHGLSLERIIESGRAVRGHIAKEKYGLASDD